MRMLSFFGFFAAVLLIDGFLHWYLWARLVRDPAWPTEVTRWLTIAVAGLALGLPLGVFLSRSLPRNVAEPIASAVYVWMGVAFILFSLVVAIDLVRWIAIGALAIYAKLGGNREAVDLARREVVTRGIAVATGATGAVLSMVALRSGLADIEPREVEVKLERLPKVLSGLSLVQLSDIHVGPLIGARFLRSVVEKANAMRPDAVVITGDLVDGGVDELIDQVAELAKLRARYGVFFVTGNHEYYAGVGPWLVALPKLGIRVLSNQRIALGDEGGSIDLAGVDDYGSERFGGDPGANLLRAMEGRDQERELVLLAHQPRQILDAAEAGVGLQLSGHTHGGQIWPFAHAVGLVQPYVAGLHRHGARSQIYVSRGTGFWGPPMRLCAPAEVTKIVLV